ncbi:Response regulator [Sulfidibacter corallicola]|uniref:Response regulator n=1 Tax=Sulfidibacter corallicola TaxID=2818388 RepID=A0A8A4TU56_SULCO|nr:response regulator [Sulfidibacter corallicola]QTD52631.1 response regulator [Sulfidibacter corallicola]
MRKILVADSANITHFMVERILGKEGFTVFYVKHARDISGQINQIMPDILFLEPEISGGKGRKICEYLARRPETNHIPIILVTRVTDTNKYNMLNWPGVQGILRKPFKTDIVLEAVQRLNLANTADFENLERESDAV